MSGVVVGQGFLLNHTQVLNVTYDQHGIPLNLLNNDGAQSFPYAGQANYR